MDRVNNFGKAAAFPALPLITPLKGIINQSGITELFVGEFLECILARSSGLNRSIDDLICLVLKLTDGAVVSATVGTTVVGASWATFALTGVLGATGVLTIFGSILTYDGIF